MLKTEEAGAFVLTWADEALARGRQQGIQQGIEEGIQEGLLRGQRSALLKVLRARFGDLPEPMTERVERLIDSVTLDRLLERAITAATLTEIEAFG